MSIEKERRDFESAYCSISGDAPETYIGHDGFLYYADNMMQRAWTLWQIRAESEDRDAKVKAAAFDNLMGILVGKHTAIHRAQREAKNQPLPGFKTLETWTVYEWTLRLQAVGAPDLQESLLDQARQAR